MQSSLGEFREEAIPFVIYNQEKRCKSLYSYFIIVSKRIFYFSIWNKWRSRGLFKKIAGTTRYHIGGWHVQNWQELSPKQNAFEQIRWIWSGSNNKSLYKGKYSYFAQKDLFTYYFRECGYGANQFKALLLKGIQLMYLS